MSKRNINIKYESYISQEEDTEEYNATKVGLTTLVLFLLSGSVSSFNIGDSIYCELSWFETSQPEGYTLSSWLILMESAGCLIVLCLLFIETHVIIFSKIGILYCSSFATLLLSLVLAFTWHFSLDGVSIFLLLGKFVGGITGWMQLIFVMPWFANNYNPRMISVFSSGNTLMISFLVFLEIIQEPGGAQIFSPKLYYLLASIVYAISFGVCVYTFHSGIGRLTSKDGVKALEPWRKSLCSQTFTPMFRETIKLAFARIWAIQISWTVVPIALAYAATNTTNSSENGGVNFLQWAIAVGYIMEFLGSVTTWIVTATGHFWIPESLALNTMAGGVIAIAACNLGD